MATLMKHTLTQDYSLDSNSERAHNAHVGVLPTVRRCVRWLRFSWGDLNSLGSIWVHFVSAFWGFTPS
jgi:hypothetical protein